MNEKRKFVRIEAPVVITYKAASEKGKQDKAICEDFSEGGIRFPIYEKLEVGTTLEMQIETPFDALPIYAVGSIVWMRPLSKEAGSQAYDVGVKFTRLDKFDRTRLTSFARSFFSEAQKKAKT
jgi:c-di-GMP-binding flagellar brake protein YcgR